MVFFTQPSGDELREGTMPLPRRLVLCIDDEVVGLQVRKMILERAGYAVLTAPDGPSGLEIFAEHPVEAVILDYAMPGMDGGQVAAAMRTKKPEVPILLLSAYVSLTPDITRNVDLYMTKGEGAPILLQKLNGLLTGESN
jgi:CheY-like chemotaxis protein